MLKDAEEAPEDLPIPAGMISNGESMPIPQSEDQCCVQHELGEMAYARTRRLGMSRRGFLRSSAGMDAGFHAMIKVFGGSFFSDARAALSNPDLAYEHLSNRTTGRQEEIHAFREKPRPVYAGR